MTALACASGRFSQKIDSHFSWVTELYTMTSEEVLRYLDLPSASMREALDLITRVAPAMTTVYINGPSGSGKEFIARQHGVHAWHGQGLTGIDFQDVGAGVGARYQGHVQHARALDVGGVMALAQHKTFVLDCTAVFANEAKRGFALGGLGFI